jgi:hypothetical protein
MPWVTGRRSPIAALAVSSVAVVSLAYAALLVAQRVALRLPIFGGEDETTPAVELRPVDGIDSAPDPVDARRPTNPAVATGERSNRDFGPVPILDPENTNARRTLLLEVGPVTLPPLLPPPVDAALGEPTPNPAPVRQ